MFSCFVANGQTNVLLEEAKAFDRQYNTPQAILKYDEALKSNPNQIAILVRMVEIYCSALEEIKEEESKKECASGHCPYSCHIQQHYCDHH
jgi:hypothetical protein